MPVYKYKDKYYDLKETDPEAAKSRIKESIGESAATSEKKERFIEPEKGKEFYRGMIAGVGGGLGEFEKFGAYTVPQFLGFKGQKPPEKGRATVFPTTEEVSGMLTKLGWKPSEKFAYAGKAGEVVGGLAPVPGTAAAKATGKAIKSAYEKGGRFIEDITGSKIPGLKGEIQKSAEEIAKRRMSELGKEAEKKIGESATAKEQQEIARRAVEKAEQKAKLAATGMKGVRAEEEFGSGVARGRTLSDIGDYIRGHAERFMNGIKSQRSATADRLFEGSLNEARAKELTSPIQATQEFRKVNEYIDSKLKVITDQDMRAQLLKFKEALNSDRAKFESIEILRRKIGDAAFGAPDEGYKAISQGMAKDIYFKISNAMRAYSPQFGKYLDDYARLSERINVFGTKLGKALVGEEKTAKGYYSVDASKIADRAFSSRDNVRQLIDAFGGNKEPVVAAARQWFGSELAGKNLEQVQSFLANRKIQDVLQELGPEFKNELSERLISNLSKHERIAGFAEKAAKERAKTIETIGYESKEILKKRQEYEDAIRTIQNLDNPDRAYEEAIKLLSKAHKEGADAKTLADLQNKVDKIKDLSEKHQKTTRTLKRILGGGAGAFGAYEAWKNL